MDMGNIADKVKDKVMGAKDKITDTAEQTKDKIADTGASATNKEAGSKNDPLTEYAEKEPMSPAKIKEHEPTAVKREMTEKISESGQTATSSQEAAEKARRSGMTKGTAGATTDTDSE